MHTKLDNTAAHDLAQLLLSSGKQGDVVTVDYDRVKDILASLADRESRYKKCDDPTCGCTEPTFTTPIEALTFLKGRMEFAGISEGVAEHYASDIGKVLANLKPVAEVTPDDVRLITGAETPPAGTKLYSLD